MPISPLSVQSRLTTKFYRDIQAALAPLVRSQSYALRIDVSVDSQMTAKMQTAAKDMLTKLGPSQSLPGLALQVHTRSLQDLIGLNARDEDLVPYIHQVDIGITLDKRLDGPAAKVIAAAAKTAIDPLHTRRDTVKISFEDLSALANEPAASPEIISAHTKNIQFTGGQGPSPDFLATPLAGSLTLLIGLAVLTVITQLKLRSLREKFAGALDGIAVLPNAMVDLMKALMKSAHATQQTILDSAKAARQSASPTSTAGTPPPAPPALRDTPVAIERHVAAKRRRLFENTEGLATGISRLLRENRERAELARFLKTLSPAETQKLSIFFDADELTTLSKLALTPSTRPDPAKLGAFIDKLTANMAAQSLATAPSLRFDMFVDSLSAEALHSLISAVGFKTRVAVVSRLPRQRRDEILQRLDEAARAALARTLGGPISLDLKTVLPEVLSAFAKNGLPTERPEEAIEWARGWQALLSSQDYQFLLVAISAAFTEKKVATPNKPQLAVVGGLS